MNCLKQKQKKNTFGLTLMKQRELSTTLGKKYLREFQNKIFWNNNGKISLEHINSRYEPAIRQAIEKAATKTMK